MKYLAALFCFVIVFTKINANENSPSDIIYIYDASGSMWGQINGQAKMQIASDVLTQSISHLPEEQKVGLVAYGHRKKGDCKDVQYIVDQDNGEKSKAIDAIKKIKPLGKTPLAYSASLVIDNLRKTSKKATVILVTDGIESCGGNICELVKEAKAEGIDFKMHIIGFGLKKGETEQLQCAATAAEGEYLDAKDAESLGELLKRATEQSIDKEDGNYWVQAVKNNEKVDAYVRAFKASTDEPIDIKRSYDGYAKLLLPSGKYDIQVQPLANSKVAPITVYGVESFDDKVTKKTVSFDAGKIGVTVTNNSEKWDTSVSVYQHKSKKSHTATRTYGKTIDIEVDPGFYDIKLQALAIQGFSKEHWFHNIEVKAKETTELAHDFKTGELKINTYNNTQGWDTATTVYAPGGKEFVTGKRTYGREISIDINPGIYDIKLIALVMKGEQTTHWIRDFEVKADQVNSLDHTFKTGIANIGAKNQQGFVDASIKIINTASNASVATGRIYKNTENNSKEFILNPGTYKVVIKPIDGALENKESIIEVQQNKTIELMQEY